MVPVYFALEADAAPPELHGSPYDEAPLPGGVTASGPFIARACGFQLHGVSAQPKEPRDESLVVVACRIDSQPHMLVTDVEQAANLALSLVETLSNLGLIGFRAMWATARRVHPEAGLATRPAGELLGAEHC